MPNPVTTWHEVAVELADYTLDMQISNFAPINPKPQYDLASEAYTKALAALRRNEDRLRNAKRARALGSRFWELTEFVYGRSAGSQVVSSTAGQLFAEARGQFDEAIRQFEIQATVENAQVVKEVAAWCLEAATHVLTRPSPAYQQLFASVLGSVAKVIEYARSQPQ